jgi:glutamine cyclotransferase
VISYRVTARYPHDRNAFTQGLVLYRGELYESTGIRGRSSVRRLDLKTGRLLNVRRLDKKQFGEGLAVLGGHLVQLTWDTGTAFIYAPEDLQQTGSFSFDGEGWGGTAVDDRLVVSDGTSRLRFFEKDSYRQLGSLQVTDGGRPVEGLNELESVGGLIYANVYPSDCVARIDSRTGQVTAWLDLGGLMPLSERPHSSAVANGIAHDPQTGELYVTGKLWPYVYRLKLLESEIDPDKQAVVPGTPGERLPK